MFADYRKFYQNIYPGNGPLSGAVNPAGTTFNRAAYNHETNRDNLFNQTDFFYKSLHRADIPFNCVRDRIWSTDRS